MLQQMKLTKSDYLKLFEHAKSKNIKCISTPFDIESLNFLLDAGIDIIKIASGEMTNAPLLYEISQKKLPIILSTGMSTLDEIERALAILAYGIHDNPRPKSFKEIWDFWQKTQKQDLSDQITILHCTTNYPAAYDEVNLNAISTIHQAFGIPVGYSDHSLGIMVPIVAAAMGAKIIEKHITLDKTMEGPDHAASLERHELKEMVDKIRDIEVIRGSYDKKPSPAEKLNIPIVRRGLYAGNNIKKGDIFTSDNLIALRPENNTSPMDYWEVLNSMANQDYKNGESL